MTADEIAARAGSCFPAAPRPAAPGARSVFDETRYGDRRADERRAQDALALEQELRVDAPPRTAGARGPVAAVPR